VTAARLGVPVVSDFRPADMAAGGKGAPLVPFLDYLFYGDPFYGGPQPKGRARPTRQNRSAQNRIAQNRIAQNLGGIANLTAIPAGASVQQLMAFDTGPGNMVIDAVMEKLFGKRYDRDGRVAASGQVLEGVVTELLRAKFFRQKPPRTAGREEFGREYVDGFRRLCRGARKADIVATATALTARSIADAVQRFVMPRFAGRRHSHGHEMIVSGGGTKNPTLLGMLREEIAPLGIELRLSDEFGLPAEAKEAVAFALLAYETWHQRPSNIPAATGARRPAILGKISYA
jgi:anhydro-N-acetylmuramic acid kinase